MAKLTLEEFKQKWSEKLKDNNDLTIELMEDTSDSFEIGKELGEKDAEIERIKGELEDLKVKYKERFLTPASKEELEEIKEDSPVELEEEKVIDIEEI